MPQVVRLSPEQLALVERLRAESARFSGDAAMRRDPAQIDRARALIDEAHAAGLPTQAYVSLQILVSSYDTAMAMPPHLRDVSML